MTAQDAAEQQRPSTRRRLAALAALAALLAGAALLLAGILVHLGGVVVAFVAFLIFAESGWYAVSRHGILRLIGLVAAAAALGVFALGVFLERDALNAWRAALVVALGATSVLAARYALKHTRRQLRAGSTHLAAADRPTRPILIMNPKSGGGKAQRFGLAEHCRQRGIEPVVLQPGDDLLALAEHAIARGADAIGMAGGDGSQALVASVAARHEVPYVCVPAGTRNHLALDLGLDRADVVGALDAFTDGIEQRIDLATVNGRTFVNNASLGLYAEIVQSPQYRGAKLRTTATMLPDLLGTAAPPLDLRYVEPGGEQRHTAHLILVSNNPYQLAPGGGQGTRERIDHGLLGIVTVMIAGAGDAQKFLALQAAGQGRRFHGWSEWSAPRFRVDSSAAVRIGVDGEALALDPPLIFESRPGALRVRLPRHALRVSPASRATRVLSGAILVQLGRVALGKPGSG